VLVGDGDAGVVPVITVVVVTDVVEVIMGVFVAVADGVMVGVFVAVADGVMVGVLVLVGEGASVGVSVAVSNSLGGTGTICGGISRTTRIFTTDGLASVWMVCSICSIDVITTLAAGEELIVTGVGFCSAAWAVGESGVVDVNSVVAVTSAVGGMATAVDVMTGVGMGAGAMVGMVVGSNRETRSCLAVVVRIVEVIAAVVVRGSAGSIAPISWPIEMIFELAISRMTAATSLFC
jgi:hypothetical protein